MFLHYRWFFFFLSWFELTINFSPPPQKQKYALISCGPGTWLLELATNYPNTKFVGIDITKAFPSEIKPKNLVFIQHDINGSLLPFPENTFDYVRMSNMNTCLKDHQWDAVLREMVRVLKPGGYIELMECDMTYSHSGPMFSKLTYYRMYKHFVFLCIPSLGWIIC